MSEKGCRKLGQFGNNSQISFLLIIPSDANSLTFLVEGWHGNIIHIITPGSLNEMKIISLPYVTPKRYLCLG